MIEPAEIFKDGVDATMIDLWQQCRRKFYNRIVRGLVSARPAIALEFGGKVHNCLEAYLRGDSEETVLALFKSSYSDEDHVGDERRTQERGLTLLKGYFKEYPRESDPFDILALEKCFHLDVGAVVPYTGRRDGVVRDKATKSVWVLEHKTTTMYGDTYQDGFEINTAADGYISAAAEEFGGCEGQLVNVLVSSVKTPRFDRFKVTRAKEQLDFWKADIRRIINEMHTFVYANWGDEKAFSLSRARCKDWNSKCAYFDVCKYCDKVEVGEWVEKSWTPWEGGGDGKKTEGGK